MSGSVELLVLISCKCHNNLMGLAIILLSRCTSGGGQGIINGWGLTKIVAVMFLSTKLTILKAVFIAESHCIYAKYSLFSDHV